MKDKIKASDLFENVPQELIPLFSAAEYPWDVLRNLKEYLIEFIKSKPQGYTEYASGVLIGDGVYVASDAVLEAPTVISKNATVKCGAYLRGSVFIGEGATVGHCTEVKNSVLMAGAQAPHFNYVGDSVLGNLSHLGAGAILSNLKGDKSAVTVRGNVEYEIGQRKLGAIIGDSAEIGCNCVLNPGTVIGKRSRIYPCISFRGVLPKETIVKASGETVKMI